MASEIPNELLVALRRTEDEITVQSVMNRFKLVFGSVQAALDVFTVRREEGVEELESDANGFGEDPRDVHVIDPEERDTVGGLDESPGSDGREHVGPAGLKVWVRRLRVHGGIDKPFAARVALRQHLDLLEAEETVLQRVVLAVEGGQQLKHVCHDVVVHFKNES